MSDAGEGGNARANAAGDNGAKKPTPPKKNDDSKNGMIGCGALLLVGVAIAVGVSQCGSDGSAQIDEQVQRDDAKSACHQWVKDKLKSPSSAKFSGETHKGTGGTYTFSGDVDSQNSFGAMIRSTWTCKVHSSGDKWRGSATVFEG